MIRTSCNVIKDSVVKDGYDYGLQVWICNFIIQRCNHPAVMSIDGPCCNGSRYAGLDIREADNS